MPDLLTNVKTINSAVRTAMVVGACSVVGYGGWFGYNNYVKPSVEAKQAIADLADLKVQFEEAEHALLLSKADLEKKTIALRKSEELNERLETSMRLLKVDRRMANVTVLLKGEDDEGNPFLEVEFIEVDEDDHPVSTPRNFTLKGDKFYVDGWVATFEDKYIENADELRSASMFVFKSIYGDAEAPRDAQRLDMNSQGEGLPGIYHGSAKGEFAEKIWADFWRVCNDSALQNELGIRTAGGRTTYIEGIEGKTYRVNIRSTGDVSLNAIESP
ncbi:MAG: hypothetical protein AB8B55_22690 [Mariniblastus sp.]